MTWKNCWKFTGTFHVHQVKWYVLTYTPYYFNIRVDLEKNGLFFSSWGNERPYAQLPLSKIRFFLSIQQLTLWPSKSENFQKFSKFGATFERVPYHLSNLSGWNYLHFYIKFHIKLRNFTDFNIWPPFWPPPIVHFLEWKCHYCPFLQ